MAMYKHTATYEEIHIPLELGGSSSLECAAEMGEFEITSDVYLSTNNIIFRSDTDRLLFEVNETVYMRVSLNSGTYSIALVELEDIQIYSNSIPSLVRCDENCEEKIELRILNEDHERFTFSFELKDSVFPQEETLSLHAQFSVGYHSPDGSHTHTRINLLTHFEISNPFRPGTRRVLRPHPKE